MPPRTRKLTAAVVAAAVLGAAAVAAAQAATSPRDASSATAEHAGRAPQPRLTSAQLDSVASKLGVTAARLQAALEANRPARPSGDRAGGPCAEMASDLASVLGVDAAKVQAILDANRPSEPMRPQGARPGRPNETALVAALASGLGLDEQAVKAALGKLHTAREAEHEARHDAQDAAIAKALGVETSAVEAAFEAVRPPRPPR
jgi:hypothetical protein